MFDGQVERFSPQGPRLDLLGLIVDRLRQVDPKSFSINHWKRHSSCRTIACAIGHACEIEEFRAAGFRLEPYDSDRDRFRPVYEKNGRKYMEFFAVCVFLKITEREAYDLFHIDSYPDSIPVSAQMVADRIAAFIRKKERACLTVK